MKVAVVFHKEEFSDEISKNAYLKACIWVAQNIISKEVEIGETFWRITKSKTADLPTFILELYAMIDIDDFSNSFCDRCREFHSTFYINQQYNCDRCNFTAFKKQMNEKLSIKKSYRQERLKYITEEY